MEHVGKVIDEQEGMVTVRFSRSTACGKCNACKLVGDNDAEVDVENILNAQIGDYVCVQLGAKGFVQASVLAYGVPLVCFVAGVGIGSMFSNAWAAILGAAGVGVGFLGLRVLEPHFAKKDKYRPRMVSLEREGQV